MTDTEIDIIYTGVEALTESCAWNFLDKHLQLMLMSIWRTDTDELVTYLTATLPVKHLLPSRKEYLETCKKLFPDEELWKGL